MTDRSPYQLAVATTGDGEAIILLPGLISGRHYFDQLNELIASQRRTVTVELLGFGESPKPPDAAYDLDQHVASVLLTLEQEGLSPPWTIMGHSMGAQVGLRLALMHEDKVRRLVLSCLPLLSDERAHRQLGQITRAGSWLFIQPRTGKMICYLHERYPRLSRRVAHRFGHREFPDGVIRDSLRHTWTSFSRSLEHTVLAHQPLAELAAVRVPTDVLYASHDPLAKDAAQKLAAINNAGLHLIGVEADHQLPLQHPELIADVLLRDPA